MPPFASVRHGPAGQESTEASGSGISSFSYITLTNDFTISNVRPNSSRLEYDNTKTADPTNNIVLDTNTNPGRVNITDAGTYKIDVAFSTDTNNNDRVVAIAELFVNGTYETGSICFTYNRDQPNGENTGNINAVLTLTANSYLEVFVSKTASRNCKAIVGTTIAIIKIA